MLTNVSSRRATTLAVANETGTAEVITELPTDIAAEDAQGAVAPVKKKWTTKQVHAYQEVTSKAASLVSAVASFHTNDDDKDWDTKLSIYIRDRAGNNIAKIENITGRFPDNTNNGPFGLSVLSNIPKTQISTNSHTDLSIVTVGHDTWRFNYFLTLGFSDGSTLQYAWTGMVLDQDVRTLTKVL